MKSYHTKKSSFKNFWKIIIQNSQNIKKQTDYIDFISNKYLISYDDYNEQKYISDNNSNNYNKQVDYSNFNQLSPEKINAYNLYDCFHGVISYICLYSENKLNNEELEFHFSGAKSTNKKQNNILNIFDYTNINLQIKISCVKNAFFGVTFKRTKIKPIAYSIRSDVVLNGTSHLISFLFEAYDEINKKWDVLDERVNINELVPAGGFNLFFIRSTSNCYSIFRIKQTEPGSNGFWGFSIAAFDVHGIIFMKDDSMAQYDIDFIKNEDVSFEFDRRGEALDFQYDFFYNFILLYSKLIDINFKILLDFIWRKKRYNYFYL